MDVNLIKQMIEGELEDCRESIKAKTGNEQFDAGWNVAMKNSVDFLTNLLNVIKNNE